MFNHLYIFLSKIYLSVRGTRDKLLFEELYWRYKVLLEKRLDNKHYKAIFTEYFGLTESFYNNKSILDVGCGPRGSLAWATMACNRVGLDPLANRYLKIHKQLANYMDMIDGHAEQMPFADETFDVVSCFNALDHTNNPFLAAHEIVRVLKPGGTVLLISDFHNKPTLAEPSTFLPSDIKHFFGELKTEKFDIYSGTGSYSAIRLQKPYIEGMHKWGVVRAMFTKPL